MLTFEEMILIAVAAVLLAVFLGLVVTLGVRSSRQNGSRTPKSPPVPPEKRAGIYGEKRIAGAIRSVLSEGDTLFTNLTVSTDDGTAEIDNAVVNKYGVFIIEVKNLRGRLEGSETDREWTKTKTSGGGNSYSMTVKNPLKQVRRQAYLLAELLKANSVEVWVEGYVVFLNNNCPVNSPMVLGSGKEIDCAIHYSTRNRLNKAEVERIIRILNDLSGELTAQDQK